MKAEPSDSRSVQVIRFVVIVWLSQSSCSSAPSFMVHGSRVSYDELPVPDCGDVPPEVPSGKPSWEVHGCWRAPTVAPGAPYVHVTSSCGLTERGVARCWSRPLERVPQYEFVALASSMSDACGLLATGDLRCWGKRVWDVPDGVSFASISVGAALSDYSSAYACGTVASSGEIVCFTGRTPSTVYPDPPIHRRGRFRQVDVRGSKACGLLEDGEVLCWSFGLSGVSGEVTLPGRHRQVSVRFGSVCTVTSDRTVACAQLIKPSAGHLAVLPVRDELEPPSGLRQVDLVRAGSQYGCALKATGELVCWGRPRPPPALRFRSLGASFGGGNNCGISIDGDTYCWGNPTLWER